VCLALQVSEGDTQGSAVTLLGNLLFPLLAFAGLFLLFRRASGGQGGMGGMGGGGPMDFGKSKSKFQEMPETGVLFEDVAVRRSPPQLMRSPCPLPTAINKPWEQELSLSGPKHVSIKAQRSIPPLGKS
jgi:hypothetical protein